MKKILFLLFFTTFCFSQKKELKVSQIDSICGISESYGFKIGHFGIQNDKKENIGKGHYELKTFIFQKKDVIVDGKSIKEDVIEELENKILIKGIYNSYNYYTNSEESGINCELYYFNQDLFYVKITLTKSIPNRKLLTENFVFKIDEKSKIKEVKNILGYNLNDVINSFNSEILDFFK